MDLERVDFLALGGDHLVQRGQALGDFLLFVGDGTATSIFSMFNFEKLGTPPASLCFSQSMFWNIEKTNLGRQPLKDWV